MSGLAPFKPMCAYTFRPREHLRKRQQFLNVFKTGTRKESRHFTCILVENGLPWRRLGLTVGKRNGNAVARNRIKRLLREYFRCNKALFPDSTDIVISARTGAARLNYTELIQELNGLLQAGSVQQSQKS
jgi:ribonuclease P protein component